MPTRSSEPALTVAGSSHALRLAAIDVGSNSIHMIVAQIDADGGVTTLWRMKEQVGLGRMSFPSRRLSGTAMDVAVATLTRFKQAAQQRGAEKIIAVATSAVREAINGGELIERVRRELKLTIKIVSARDEARLIYLAVKHSIDLKKRDHLIIDIGGGSVEFVVGNDARATLLESRKLGAARMTAKFVHSDPLEAAEADQLRRHYAREVGPLVKKINALKPTVVIGTSGTLENLAAMSADGKTPGALAVDRVPFERLLKKLVTSDAAYRTELSGLDAPRREQIVAGAMLVGELFERVGMSRIEICSAAMREGIIVDYLSRHAPDLHIRREVPDPRHRSIVDLARKTDFDSRHSEHVAALAMKLFDSLAPLHKLGATERELIQYGCLLHDIGFYIADSSHNKHSAYLIRNAELPAFSRGEIEVVANIARYHRKSPPTKRHDRYAALLPAERRIVDVGAAILRIADGLDRSHAQNVTAIRVAFTDRDVIVRLGSRVDAELEAWGAERKADWFEKVFRRKLVIKL